MDFRIVIAGKVVHQFRAYSIKKAIEYAVRNDWLKSSVQVLANGEWAWARR